MGGSPRVTVETGQSLPDMGWGDELASLTSAWPYLGPTWLTATEKAMPEAQPWHTIATRSHQELALLPGYVLDSPPAVNHEPRTYLGWRSTAEDEGCCGADCDTAVSDEVGALGTAPFFPALLLGSPLGYRTEVAYNFWTPSLMEAMAGALVPAAFESGIRCVIAPWIPDRRGNDSLVNALIRAGGHSTFWGYEDYMRLDADSWEAHLAALPLKKRQRIRADIRKCAAEGIVIDRVIGDGVRPHVARIAELTCLNREKNGAGQDPAQITEILTSLLDGGADLRAWLGRKDGAVVAACVAVCKDHRMFVKWAGFNYSGVDERSGIYFALVLDAPVSDAYAEGMRTVEFGADAHQAKALRGCTPRSVTTVIIMSDPELRALAAGRLDGFGASRRAAFGGPLSPSILTPVSASPACCANG